MGTGRALVVGSLIGFILYLTLQLAFSTIEEDLENAHINYNQGIQQ